MTYSIENLININYRGDSPGFTEIECNAIVNNDWKNWVINFIGSLSIVVRGDKDSNCYNILNNYDEWADSLLDERIKCNRIIFPNKVWAYLPPCIQWISPSGRFACIELGSVLSIGNYFLLWDILNEELLKLEFHDLEGMNETKCILYCRTLNDIHPYGYNHPFKFNTNSINSELEWVSLENIDPNSVYFEESQFAHELVLKVFGTKDDDEFDLSNASIGDLIFLKPK